MHVEWGTTLLVEDRFIRLEEAEHLPLVVGGATGVELSVPHGGLEGVGGPLLQGVRGLDVVVSVDQQRRASGDHGTLCPDHRVPRPLYHFYGRASQVPQVGGQPGCRPPTVGGVRRQCADAGDGEELAQLLQQAGLLVLDKGSVHRNFLVAS
jgi:hypothetical protein